MNDSQTEPFQEVSESSPAGDMGWRATAASFSDWLRGFIYGMTYYEMERQLRKERADLEHLFILISFGDVLGVPILPPYYSLRLLPFTVPLINQWRRRMLRERDLTDLIG